jgi:uncharacterized membrane protein YjjP (DUF1212 family)
MWLSQSGPAVMKYVFQVMSHLQSQGSESHHVRQCNVWQLAARSGLSVQVLLVVQVCLFHKQLKNLYKKENQHRQWSAIFVDMWSLTVFHTFGWTNKWMDIDVPSLRRSPGW